MSELSVLLQARREIKEELERELKLPKWSRSKVTFLNTLLNETNEDICCLVERGSEGDLTLC